MIIIGIFLEKENDLGYIGVMYEKIVNLVLQVSADITLSERAKDEILTLLNNCSSPEELSVIERSLQKYWDSTGVITSHALQRRTPEELRRIQQMLSGMLTGSRNIVERAIRHHESHEINHLLSSL